MSTHPRLAHPRKAITISELRATCSAVLEGVNKTGQPLLVTRRGKPIAQILPPPQPEPLSKSAFGCMAGTVRVIGDIVEPLGTEDWEVFRE